MDILIDKTRLMISVMLKYYIGNTIFSDSKIDRNNCWNKSNTYLTLYLILAYPVEFALLFISV